MTDRFLPYLRPIVASVFLALGSTLSVSAAETFRAVRVPAEAKLELVQTFQESGFTHVLVQLPYFRGANDPDAIAYLRSWSNACAETQIEMIPHLRLCGPKEAVLSDPIFPADPTRSLDGQESPFKPSLLDTDYWSDSFVRKMRTLLLDDGIAFQEVCLDFTCTIDGKTYEETDGYEEGYLSSFPPVAELQLGQAEMTERIGSLELEVEYRQHAIAKTAEAFAARLEEIGPIAKNIRFGIDGYRHTRLYEGIARGLARTDLPTRCFLHGTESHYGWTPELKALSDDSMQGVTTWVAPRLDISSLLPGELATAAEHLATEFGGFLIYGSRSFWFSAGAQGSAHRLKGSIESLTQALTAARDGRLAELPPVERIQQLRIAAERRVVTIRGPLNRGPLFPGSNSLVMDLSTIDPELRGARIAGRLIRPELSAEPLEAVNLEFSDDRQGRIEIPITVRRGGWHQVVLTAHHKDSGAILGREAFSLRALPAWDASLDKSYYTIEEGARLRVRRHDGDSVLDLRLSAKLTGADVELKPYPTRSQDLRTTLFLFDISTLPPGEYTVTVSGSAPSEDPEEYILPLHKYPPAKREIKLLHHRGDLLEVDGRPRFVLGAFGVEPEECAALHKLGVNATVGGFSAPDDILPLLDAAAESGIGVGLNPFDPLFFLVGNEDSQKEELAWFDRDAVMFYYNSLNPEEANVSPYALEMLYDFVRTQDPYRPQALEIPANDTRYDDTVPLYLHAMDILLMSSFPLPTGPMARFDRAMIHATQVSDGRAPVWAVPQAFDWRSWDRKHFDAQTYCPGERELRYTCYSTVAHGGRGILFWSLDVLRRHPETIGTLKKVLAEFARLRQVLIQEDAILRLTVEPADGAVHAMGKWYKGNLYLFAVNGDWFPQEVTFRFQRLVPASISEWREGRSIQPFDASEPGPPEGAGFRDTIEGAGVRLYIIEPSS